MNRPKPKIVVLDDERLILQFIELCLEGTPWTVATFTDPEVALRHARDAAVLLMDLHLPDMSGQAFLRRLRGLGYQTPVIGITASRPPELIQEVLEAGVCDHLAKPFDRQTLLAKLQQHTLTVEPANRQSTSAGIETCRSVA